MVPDVALGTLNNTTQIPQLMQQNQAAGNELQAQDIANQQKKLAYAGMVMSAASAPVSQSPTGEIDPQTGQQRMQNNYNDQMIQSAKQHLQGMNIDTSMFGNDGATVAQQAQQLRMALMPPASLLNSQIQLQRNQTMAAGVNGTTAPAGLPSLTITPPTIAGTASGAGAVNGAQQPTVPTSTAQSQPSARPPALPPSAPGANIPVMQQAAAGQPQTQKPAALQTPQQMMAAAQNDALARAQARIPAPAPNANPEAISRYNDSIDKAMQSDMQYQQDVESAKALGTGSAKNITDTNLDAVKSEQSIGPVEQTIQGLITLAKKGNLPEGATANISGDAYSLVAPNSETAQDVKSFNMLNEAQTIGAIRELANTGQLKMSRTLENILNKGYLVDPTASNPEKVVQANIVLNELKNSAISSKNVSAQLTGGAQTPYLPMTVSPATGQTAAPPVYQAGQILDSPSLGKVVFKGGDATDKNNYVKVGK